MHEEHRRGDSQRADEQAEDDRVYAAEEAEAESPESTIGEAESGETEIAIGEPDNAGAAWFYWIAALSLVNAAISLAGGDGHFVIGLGITAVINAVAIDLRTAPPPRPSLS